MARNGSGTYNRTQSPYQSGQVISSSAVNSEITDIGNEISNSIAADGQTTPTANLPMGTYRHTGVGNASARTHYGVVGQIQDKAYTWCGTAGGTADALTLSPTPAITAYAAGQSFEFKAGTNANTGPANVAISGLSAIALQLNGAALAAGDIAANQFYRGTLDTTSTVQIERIGQATAAAASETVAGVVEIATAAETTTGTDDTRAITPLKLTTFAPATATVDTANDLVLFLDNNDSNKVKKGSFPSTTPTAAQGASLVLIQAQTASSSATIDFTTGIDSTYDEYILMGWSIVPASSAVRPWLRVSEDGGSTWKAGGTDYAAAGGGTAAQMTQNYDISNGATDTYSFATSFFAPSASGRAKLFSPRGGASVISSAYTVGSVGQLAPAGAYIGTTNAINGVRFLASSGNVASGVFALYGVKKS